MKTPHEVIEEGLQKFSSKFYYPIQQQQVEYEDIFNWLRTFATKLVEVTREEEGE